MSKSAEEALEFDKLRELLRLRATCVLGRRAIDALRFSRHRGDLERQFALIREAREWLRSGRDLGFGGLSDPAGWLSKIAGPGGKPPKRSGRGARGELDRSDRVSGAV